MSKLVYWLGLLIIYCFFIIYNFFYAVDFPFQDDFLLIQFVEAVTKPGADFAVFLRELFSVHNDHKAVVPRLIALGNYSLTGTLNFRAYTVITAINISLIFWFLYQQFKRTSVSIAYFLPAALFFFHPLYHDITGWSLNGMQHSISTVFTIGSIVMVCRRTWSGVGWGILMGLMATFTHGNGIFSFPALIFCLILFAEWKKSIVVVLGMFLALGFYLYGYQFGQAAGLPDNFWAPFESFTGFIGASMMVWTDQVIWSVIWGGLLILIVLILIVLCLKSMLYQEESLPVRQIPLLGVFVYMLVMSMVIAVFRSSAGGAITSRFQIYAAMSTVIVYLLLLDLGYLRNKFLLHCISLIGVVYCTYSYYRFTRTVENKQTTYLADVFNWVNNRELFSVERSLQRNASFYLFPATDRGILRMPEPRISKAEIEKAFSSSSLPMSADSSAAIFDWNFIRSINGVVDSLTYFYISQSEAPPRLPLLSNRFLALRNIESGKIWLHAATPEMEGRKAVLTIQHYHKSGFQALFRNDDLIEGRYQLLVVDVSRDGSKKFYHSHLVLVSQGGKLLF
ncbi:hypothetical protein [Dyadobacter tibetensis]|uniref:hypothetical protein n=1 Tax=Dyadobacter tibetensis TaxID=1211851 RepID=UPI00047020BA|nr:hypothetical protein [Dyadobacter tibetensis]